jgi:hypothetical protein
MIDDEVLYVSATSGIALKMVVELIGARNPQSDRMAVMKSLRWDENLSYCAAFTSINDEAWVGTGWMSW